MPATASAELTQPRREDLRLEAALHALSDPVRLHIVRQLAASEEPRACGSLGLPVTKSTATHHFRVLREAGLISQRDEGRARINTLRRGDIEARFPGLLKAVLSAS
jgi:DNA-binding transcriptional ArsR family regulator